MDSLRGAKDGDDPYGADTPGVEAPPVIGQDERRMHVRAYNFWAKLLDGRAFPNIASLDAKNLGEFSPHSVLLDFATGIDNPTIVHVGSALAAECDLSPDITQIADVPRRSLLSRLTDHYLQIIANRTPIGFEAEFVNGRDETILYRGVLLPFSSNGENIDFILGVINWKRAAEPALSEALNAEMAAAALASPVRKRPQVPAWADGPVAQDAVEQPSVSAAPSANAQPAFNALTASLSDWLIEARTNAEASVTLRTKSAQAKIDAIVHAWGFACVAEEAPEDYAELLEDAGIAPSLRAPMTPLLHLVFGADCDKAVIAGYTALFNHAAEHDIAPHLLGDYIAQQPGGLDGLVTRLTLAKRSIDAFGAPQRKKASNPLDHAPAIATVALSGDDGDSAYAVLIARRNPDGSHAIIATVPEEDSAYKRALKAAERSLKS